MAAEAAVDAGAGVTVFDQRRSFGRTMLLAGRSGLNFTHSEPLDAFLANYPEGRDLVENAIRSFTPDDVQRWADGLNAESFVGSSGRVFPKDMRATALLRAWLARLEAAGVEFVSNTAWQGFDQSVADASVLALGGGSWPGVGGDGSWQQAFSDAEIAVEPLQASNVGVLVDWSSVLLDRHEGYPLKNVALRVGDSSVRGEPTITKSGLEGGPVYALGSPLRAGLESQSSIEMAVDAAPDRTVSQLAAHLTEKRRVRDSTSTWLRRSGVTPAVVDVIRDVTGNDLPQTPEGMARLLKAIPVPVRGLAPVERAISTSGGVAAAEIDPSGMLRKKPGWWVAGEMMAWDAPTGGYLMQACLSTGHRAGQAAAAYQYSS